MGRRAGRAQAGARPVVQGNEDVPVSATPATDMPPSGSVVQQAAGEVRGGEKGKLLLR